MRHVPLLAALGLSMLGAGAAAQGPAAPSVTVSNGTPKQLRFQWNYVPRANYYELWFRSNPGATEVKVLETPSWQPRATTSEAVHLLDWSEARYRVKACNPSGCTATAPISVEPRRLGAIGLIKSSFPLDHAGFGSQVALSDDNQTLAVLAPFEANDHFEDEDRAAVYLYRRAENGAWALDARIAPELANVGSGSYATIALSGDGKRLSFASPTDRRAGETTAGSVFVYTRTGAGAWRADTRIHVGELPAEEAISAWTTDLDTAGNTLIVGLTYGGAVGIYSRANGKWTRTGTLPGKSDQPYDLTCAWDVELSGDGKVLVRACGDRAEVKQVEVYAAPAWTLRDAVRDGTVPYGLRAITVAVDRTGDTIAVGWQPPFEPNSPYPSSVPFVSVYERGGGAYLARATLRPGIWQWLDPPHTTRFAQSGLAISGDGKLIAVGDDIDRSAANGPVPMSAALDSGPDRGAVYVFEKRPSGWPPRRLVKPDLARRKDTTTTWFGSGVALGGNGRTLAVGDPFESTFVRNPASVQGAPDGDGSGAVWIY
jgi:hypothetical protein